MARVRERDRVRVRVRDRVRISLRLTLILTITLTLTLNNDYTTLVISRLYYNIYNAHYDIVVPTFSCRCAVASIHCKVWRIRARVPNVLILKLRDLTLSQIDSI